MAYSINSTKLSRELVINVPTNHHVDEIIDMVLELSANSEIRKTDDGCLSVYDAIAKITAKSNPRRAWSVFIKKHPEAATKCRLVEFSRSNGRKASCESLGSDLAGIVEIILLMGIKSRNVSAEKKISNKLARQYKGATEVPTPVGDIDVLTSTEVIEVKKTAQWKGAIGQVLSYAHFYPSHAKRIHLFGSMHSSVLRHVLEICDKHDIRVTFEDEQ